MWIGSKYPQIFISPFDHGIELNPDRPYSYIRALYNTIVCVGSGVIVGLLTSPMDNKKTEGLTVWSLDKAREYFKGSIPNDTPGQPVIVNWKSMEKDKNTVNFSVKDMEIMGAKKGDLVYICDKRKWLGGLKSVHSVYGEPHDIDGLVYITNTHLESARFQNNLKLIAEKEL